jgi:hypothetical protein
MGGGSRHSKNAGSMNCEGQTYSERAALGFGTQKERLGKVRMKDNLYNSHITCIENIRYVMECYESIRDGCGYAGEGSHNPSWPNELIILLLIVILIQFASRAPVPFL